VFEKDLYAKRALRELIYLAHFTGHENITSVMGLAIVHETDYKDM
jgi:mitogen-activated protein kinase 7